MDRLRLGITRATMAFLLKLILTEPTLIASNQTGGWMVEWFRALVSMQSSRVQIPLWPPAGVFVGSCLVQLLGHPCK